MEEQLKEFVEKHVTGLSYGFTMDKSGMIVHELDGRERKIQGIKQLDSYAITIHCQWHDGEPPEFVKALFDAMGKVRGND